MKIETTKSSGTFDGSSDELLTCNFDTASVFEAFTNDHKRCDQEHSWLKISSPPSPSTDGFAGQGNPLFISVFALLQGIRQRTFHHPPMVISFFNSPIRNAATKCDKIITRIIYVRKMKKWAEGKIKRNEDLHCLLLSHGFENIIFSRGTWLLCKASRKDMPHVSDRILYMHHYYSIMF